MFRDFPKSLFLHNLRVLLRKEVANALDSMRPVCTHQHAKKVLREDNIAITATTTSNNSNKNLSSKNNDQNRFRRLRREQDGVVRDRTGER